MTAYGPCFACKRPFTFNPHTVPSISIDPANGKPPDLGGNPEAAVRQPICPSCARLANEGRAARGLPLWREDDTSLEVTEG